MNALHLHLMLTHVPVVGVLCALALLAAGVARRSDVLVRAGAWALVAVAAAAGATFLTGEPAEHLLDSVRRVPESLIEPHEEMAESTLVAALLLGVAALVALFLRRGRAMPRRLAGAGLVATVAVATMFAWTANLGGRIAHPEIRGATIATPGSVADADR
jgi:uncharacterized membrane protein